MTRITRRELVRGSAAGLAALGLPSYRSAPRALRRGRSDELRAAVIGLRGRGRDHVSGLLALPGVRIVALCDVDSEVLGRATAEVEARVERVEAFTDVRRVLDSADVDLVSIATPNHWHALMTVWACQAGKDVYVEKPVSHNLWEGRQMVRAARKYGRIVQTGTQCRSSSAIAEGLAWVRAGNLGRITLARGLCYKPRQSIGRVLGPAPVPASVDYDLWTGPAPLKPLRRRNLHYDWHWVFDTGNGDLGNQGVHQVDLCRWALGAQRIAPRTTSIGGRFGYDDDGSTPNTMIAFFDYEPAPLVFEVRGLPKDRAARGELWSRSMDRYDDMSIGVVVHCEGGSLRIPDYASAHAYDGSGALVRSWEGAEDHFANFVDAVRSRRVEDLEADIEEGHVSSALCHVANASYQLGACADPSTVRERLRDDPAAAETYERFAAHLAANGIDLAREPAVLGQSLELDPEAERCTSHPAAEFLLKRAGREPFAMPESV